MSPALFALMTTGVLSTVVDHLNLEAEIGGYEAKTREIERIEECTAASPGS